MDGFASDCSKRKHVHAEEWKAAEFETVAGSFGYSERSVALSSFAGPVDRAESVEVRVVAATSVEMKDEGENPMLCEDVG